MIEHPFVKAALLPSSEKTERQKTFSSIAFTLRTMQENQFTLQTNRIPYWILTGQEFRLLKLLLNPLFIHRMMRMHFLRRFANWCATLMSVMATWKKDHFGVMPTFRSC